ncbi:MAG: ABC transporter permease subunit [bacterium]|nr:ABC transporter permease subunit [bacterium]
MSVFALGFQTLPSVCWLPLSLLWFGQSESAILFVVLMGCLWSIILSTEGGMSNVSPIYAKAARTMGSRRFHTLFFVIFPAALPAIISGMKL